MNKKQYCRKLLNHRGKMMPFRLFLGGRWIFLKVVLLVMGMFLLMSASTSTKVAGGVVIGYALGKIAAGWMSYRIAKATWPYTEELIDWDKVSECVGKEDTP